MDFGLFLHPTGAGLALAAAAVIAGAPLFSDGLRAVRLRRNFARLRSEPLSALPTGFVHVRGHVALESPMFAPLSHTPCAGFRLELRVANRPAVHCVDEHRRFRLSDGDVNASVLETGARWELPVSAEREIAATEALTDHLATLLARAPEMKWARREGATLHLTERALPIGAECHVVGFARHGRPAEVFLESEQIAGRAELLRTGTDGGYALGSIAVQSRGVPSAATRAAEPDLWLGCGEHLDFLLVTSASPALERFRLPAWRSAGAVLGPVLSMGGLLYLASALDFLRASAQL